MSVSLQIVPLLDSVDMFGHPDRNSAYSLCGHITISLHPAASSFFDSAPRTTRLLLQSLELTFEGQSELLTPNTGYCPIRLCSVTRQLAPTGPPVEFSNEGHEDSDVPCTWNVLFSLPIPGWLPATSHFGDDQHGQAGVSYALHATAKFTAIDDDASSRSWFSLSSLCSAFSSRSHITHAAPFPIALHRFMSAPSPPEDEQKQPSSTSSVYGGITFQTTTRSSNNQPRATPTIPAEVLDKLRVFVRVPEHVAIGADTLLPLSLRLQADNLSDEESKRLRVAGFSVNVEQLERYRPTCPIAYSTAFPMSSSAQQPPHVPLRTMHPLQAVYELGLGPYAPDPSTQQRTFSLLGRECSGEFRFAGDERIFARSETEDEDHGNALVSIRSYAVEAPLPLVSAHADVEEKAAASDLARLGWSAPRVMRPTADSPQLAVRHRMHVALLCLWDGPAGGEREEAVAERVEFSVPLSFVHARLPAPKSGAVTREAVSEAPYVASALPAYSQLFYPNGERKLEYGLPAYEPVDPAPVSACA